MGSYVIDGYIKFVLKDLKEYIENVLETGIIDNEFITELENRAEQLRRWYNENALKSLDELLEELLGNSEEADSNGC